MSDLVVFVVVLIALYEAFVAWTYLRRVVTRISLTNVDFDITLNLWLRSGTKGFSVFVCHPLSQTLVRIYKTMPENRAKSKVSLYVSKIRLVGTRRKVNAYRYRHIRGYECAPLWFWQLPNLHRAQVIEKVRCLGSLERTFHALNRMLSEEGITKDGSVLLWCSPGKRWFTGSEFGAFDD